VNIIGADFFTATIIENDYHFQYNREQLVFKGEGL